MDPDLFGSLIDIIDDEPTISPEELKSDFIVSLHWDKLTWEAKAQCRVDHEDMFPVRGDKQRAVADRVCSKCDYQRECLLLGMVSDSRYGVWGGTTEKERELLLEKFELTYPNYNENWDERIEEAMVNFVSLVINSRINKVND